MVDNAKYVICKMVTRVIRRLLHQNSRIGLMPLVLDLFLYIE